MVDLDALLFIPELLGNLLFHYGLNRRFSAFIILLIRVLFSECFLLTCCIVAK